MQIYKTGIEQSMKKRTKVIIGIVTVIGVLAIVGSRYIAAFQERAAISIIGGADGPTAIFVAGKVQGGDKQVAYTSITMDEAREIFQTEGDYLILDVRRADEFAEGHIPGAINIANEDIKSSEPKELQDKEQTIYVYCRSGNRSKQAAAKLAAMGYINIVEFGGIIDWTGDIEK